MGYDASPFKVRPCDKRADECKYRLNRLLAQDLPDPGVALPEGVDHWHVVPRGGGDNRGARDLQRWKTLMLSLTRCEHGRTHGDQCYSCPEGWSPSRAGTEVGYTYAAERVVIPPREEHNDPEAWVRDSPKS